MLPTKSLTTFLSANAVGLSLFWHCPRSVRSRVYETVRCPPLCPSVCSTPPLQLPSARDVIDIDRLLHGRRTAANAGSATFSAYVGNWTQTCLFKIVFFHKFVIYQRQLSEISHWTRLSLLPGSVSPQRQHVAYGARTWKRSSADQSAASSPHTERTAAVTHRAVTLHFLHRLATTIASLFAADDRPNFSSVTRGLLSQSVEPETTQRHNSL